MDLDSIAFDRRFGHPVVKDGCGVFGMLRKAGCAPDIQPDRRQRDILYQVSRERPWGGLRSLQDIGRNRQQHPTEYRRSSRGRRSRSTSAQRSRTESASWRISPCDVVDPRRRELSVWEATSARGAANSDSIIENAVDSVNASLFSGQLRGSHLLLRHVSQRLQGGRLSRRGGQDVGSRGRQRWGRHVDCAHAGSPPTLPARSPSGRIPSPR